MSKNLYAIWEELSSIFALVPMFYVAVGWAMSVEVNWLAAIGVFVATVLVRGVVRYYYTASAE